MRHRIGFLAAAFAIIDADIQVFTADGTWTKPVGASSVEVYVFGAGGGGGGGCSAGSGTHASGGGGGGAGGFSKVTFAPGVLGATEPVVVGLAGASGLPNNNGGTGLASTFSSSGNLVTANPGTGGVKGGLPGTPSALGGTGGTGTTTNGGDGGLGGRAVGNDVPTAGSAPGGGGGGGGMSATLQPSTSGLDHSGKAGAVGGKPALLGGSGGTYNINGSPTWSPVNPGTPVGVSTYTAAFLAIAGGGGGGMVSLHEVVDPALPAAAVGSAGARPGGGGGGGGGERNGTGVGQAGGAGGGGLVVVITT